MTDSHSSTSSVVLESVVAFLEKVPPFQFLSHVDRAKLARTMALEFFAKDSMVLSAGERAAESLYIVQKGAVKLALRTQVGKEVILDMRTEGELFGLLSLMGGNVARLDVTAVEDTLCYSIPGFEVQRLMSQHADVADYLVRTSVRRYMDRSLKELRSQTQLMGEAERLLYALKVQDVVARDAVTCSSETSIRDAAKLVATSRSTSVIVVDASGGPLGIVTEQDFTRKVVGNGLNAEQPVERIMSSPIVSVEHTALVFQALLAMLTHDIQHVLVTEEGKPKSILTTHDLMLLQGKSPLNVARHLEQQLDVKGLAEAQKQIINLLPLLLREGAKASHVTRVVAEINDRLIAKIFELAHQELGPAPVQYCWVVLGSEGRREQTFKTDQDNALIYADGASAEHLLFFEQLVSWVNQALKQCGYPDCEGGYMATNRKWRNSISEWKGIFETWIREGELHATEDALIFFDMRPLAGEPGLFQDLSAHIRELLKPGGGLFKSILGSITIEHKPPLGFFRKLVLEHSGEHKQGLDIKMFGTGPIVNAARLFALDCGVEATNTLDRLAALPPDYLEQALSHDLQQAFEFLTLLRLEQQMQLARKGQPLSNHLGPETLTPLQKSMLKDTFQTIARVQELIDQRFRTAVWTQMGR